MNKNKQLTQQYLKECLNYDENTGIFTWRIDRPLSHFKNLHGQRIFNNRVSINPVGSLDFYGYIVIRILGKLYGAHRLAWLYVYGYFPAEDTDHINGVRTDNRIENLREATRSENNQNIKKCKKNSETGFLGVRANKRDGTFVSRINTKGTHIHLGTFKTAELAHEAYLKAKRELHPFGTL